MSLPAPSKLPVPGRGRPLPPTHLQEDGKRLWTKVVAEYELGDHHLELLRLAAEALDRAEQARVILAADGLTTKDRYGSVKPHPAVTIEKDSAIRAARLIRELGLDLETPVTRPPTRWRP